MERIVILNWVGCGIKMATGLIQLRRLINISFSLFPWPLNREEELLDDVLSISMFMLEVEFAVEDEIDTPPLSYSDDCRDSLLSLALL